MSISFLKKNTIYYLDILIDTYSCYDLGKIHELVSKAKIFLNYLSLLVIDYQSTIIVFYHFFDKLLRLSNE